MTVSNVWRGAAAGIAFLSSAGAAAGADSDMLAKAFGARESVRQISLSPDGTKLAMIMPTSPDGERLAVVDLTGEAKLRSILVSKGKPDRISFCRWPTNDLILCSASFVRDDGAGEVGYTRLFTLHPDGSGMKAVSKESNNRSLYAVQHGGSIVDWQAAGAPGRILLTRQFVPETGIGSSIRHDKEGLGVESVDLETQARTTVEAPRSEASEFISDGFGQVRIIGTRPRQEDGYLSKYVNYSYRRAGSREWEKLSQQIVDSQTAVGFEPYAVDSKKNVVYGFDDANGFQALYQIALDGSLKKDLVFGRGDADVDGLIRLGRSRRVVGASYATEKRQTEFFDPELKALRASLGRAIPNRPIINFIDSSADESKLLILAGSDTDPGMFYLFDKASKKLEEVMPVRLGLEGVPRSKVTPITFPGPDGVQVPGYLTLPAGSDGKNLPAIVMPHGGPSARDEWGFDWLSQYFVARGFAVLQPNFRGSSGYGSAWFQKNGFQSWRTAIGDVNAAGRWLESQGIAAKGKMAIFGWSYGGYAALQSPVLDPDLFKAIVAVAPVTDLTKLREEHRMSIDFKLVDAFIGQGPHIREGSPAQNARMFKAPVLIFQGDIDKNVGVGEARYMKEKLTDAGKSVEYVEFKGLDHYLDDSDARFRMLSRSDAFIRQALGL